MVSRLTKLQGTEREALNDGEQMEWMPSSHCKLLEKFLENVTYKLSVRARESQEDEVAY